MMKSLRNPTDTLFMTLLERARLDVGVCEIPGRRSTPLIRRMILDAADWLESDDSLTAWCGCAVLHWCRELRLEYPKQAYRAVNWLKVGVPISREEIESGKVPMGNIIAVLKRTGGHHVTILESLLIGGIRGLGGNQGNCVNSGLYLDEDLIEFRLLSRYPTALASARKRDLSDFEKLNPLLA